MSSTCCFTTANTRGTQTASRRDKGDYSCDMIGIMTIGFGSEPFLCTGDTVSTHLHHKMLKPNKQKRKVYGRVARTMIFYPLQEEYPVVLVRFDQISKVRIAKILRLD